MINGIIQTFLKQIHDERGKVMHMLRSSDPHFQEFGEIYFSWIYPDVIKSWHKHTEMIMNYADKRIIFSKKERKRFYQKIQKLLNFFN